MKKYDTFYKDVYSQDPVPEGTYGSIQWKGTDVCMDIFCPCGHHSHVDATFFYYFECIGCGKKFAVGANVAMIPLTDEQIEHAGGRHRFRRDVELEEEWSRKILGESEAEDGE